MIGSSGSPSRWLGWILLLGLATVTADEPRPTPLPRDTLPADRDLSAVPLGLRELPPVPPGNPLTPERVALGRRLFFDPILSRDGGLSCASCHQPEHGFAAPEPRPVGHAGQIGRRNAPSLLNRGYGKTFFWDGRARSLEEQVLQPIDNPTELGGSLVKRLEALRDEPGYVEAFSAAFPSAGPGDAVSRDHLSQALASFVRSLTAGDTPVDRFHAGDFAALDDAARRGLWIFDSRGGCWRCHSGPTFSDERFHNTGVGFGEADRDEGRFEVTGRETDRHAFRTPPLRGVAHTAPYMHDGSQKTLEEVVRFYDRGGSPADPGLDRDLKPLDLDERAILDLVAFLEALSRFPPQDPPPAGRGVR